MRLGDFSVHIIVDGKELEEYGVVQESPKKVTCWIASEEGKNFSLRWKCHKQARTYDACGLLSLDGVQCSYNVGPSPGGTKSISYIRSQDTRRSLLFSRVQLTDEKKFLDKKVRKGFGEISLNVANGRRLVQLVNCDFRSYPDIRATPGGKLYGRSSRAMVHCVSLGPKVMAIRQAVRKTSCVTFNKEPELDLVFKYRPLAVLQAAGIAPKPAPSDSDQEGSASDTSHDSLDTDSDSETTALDSIIEGLENELEHLRDLRASISEGRKRKRVTGKQESSPRKRLAVCF